MRILTVIYVFITLFLYSCRDQKQNIKQHSSTLPVFSALNAQFPLTLSELDLKKKDDLVQLNDGINSKIELTILSYYLNECSGDSSETYFKVKDTFIGVIQLHENNWTIYMILFNHFPDGQVNSKLLFYNNIQKCFIKEPFDFNLHAMYDFDYGKLKTSSLKKQFKINSPEIEIIDFDKDAESYFKLTRLFHNGTANAIETILLKVADNKLDTLSFNRKWIGNGTENP